MDKHAQTGWFTKLVSRRSLLATSTVGLAVPAAMTLGSAAPMHTANAQQGVVKKVTIYAEDISSSLLGYGLEPGKATVPGPLLEIYEGDTLEITLVNRTARRLSIHPHGVDYSTDSDGAPLNNSFNNPGETRVYTWRSREMAAAGGGSRKFLPGSAGYWHYHDHAAGTDHGTVGIAKGLYGGLIVRRRGDLLPDKQFVAVFNEMSINNLIAPNTPVFEANLGQRVEFLAIGHGNQFHTFHLHAHRWADNRTGYLESPSDPSPAVDNKDLNPGSSFGFQVIAGEGVGPGAWMYHCHVQDHSERGMSGIFLVRNADGSMPPGAQEAIDRFKGHVHSATATTEPVPLQAPATGFAPAPAAPGAGHGHH